MLRTVTFPWEAGVSPPAASGWADVLDSVDDLLVDAGVATFTSPFVLLLAAGAEGLAPFFFLVFAGTDEELMGFVGVLLPPFLAIVFVNNCRTEQRN